MSGKPAIAVLGAGSWGTALAILISGTGRPVNLWDHLPEHINRLRQDRENRLYLPGFRFPDNLSLEEELANALHEATEVLVAVPSHAFRSVLETARPFLENDTSLSWATKGFEPRSRRLLHEVAREILGKRDLAVISGPSFAIEVAKGLPTAITVAAESRAHAERIADYLHADFFRAYTSEDIIGVQVGGAAKNVLAIAAGIADGLGFGANTRAALITRGLAELMRFGKALGGEPETFMGLAGLGDLALTCTDDQSRNRRMGLFLAKGLSVEEARSKIGQEVEGVQAAEVIHLRAGELGVDMPISEQVYRVLYRGLKPADAVHSLLGRKLKPEFE